ncbi:MAG: hypothetical protein ABSG45_03480 [Nitrososphaerales archaeon]
MRARAGEKLLDSTNTDSSGRFLLEWDADRQDDETVIELVDSGGEVSESIELTKADLVSPPVVVFSGERVIGIENPERETGREVRFEAEGDYPVCVLSACQDANLSWGCPSGSRVSILSEGGEVRGDLPPSGSLSIDDANTRRYTLRIWQAGAGAEEFSDRTLEVRRYPSLSLVIDGVAFRTGSEVEFGISTSCPAGQDGLEVAVRSSDLEMVTGFGIRIPAGSRWATARVVLGSKSGGVKVTAFAAGYTRDGVNIRIK